MVNLRNRHFLKEVDFTAAELEHLLRLSAALKMVKYAGTEVPQLTGKEIALIFEKTSTRTRSAFEVAAYDQGAHVTYLDPSGSQMGHKESIADTARVLGRMYDGIEYRGAAQAAVEELAAHAGVPVYNGLTDEWHPTQMLADFLTMHEASHKPYDALSYCYMGDARSNVARSLLVMGAIMGADVRICGPKELLPPEDVRAIADERAAASGALVTVTDDPDEALPGADFVYTDVWVSMGEPKEVWDERIRLLKPYQVNRAAMERTGNRRARFLHCLPAFHDAKTTVGAQIAQRTGMTDGIEVTDEVFESPASIVFDQAENRLHTIKAVLVATLGAN
ncbi:MAG: ornithine carbamoyltransferase [Solirubrobacteraceae bacterium]|nr:ornithine carbamoyltransferase [Solirubrobacteraceae bacterium]